jgi:hypothetical protein
LATVQVSLCPLFRGEVRFFGSAFIARTCIFMKVECNVCNDDGDLKTADLAPRN